jgi:hypothetical protein
MLYMSLGVSKETGMDRVPLLALSPSAVLYILIDGGGDDFGTSRMYSTSGTSWLYLQVWGGDPRHAGGAPVLDVRPFSRPGALKNKPVQVKTPPPGYLIRRIAIDGWRLVVRPVANLRLALDGAPDRQLRYGIRAGLAFEIHFGARLMELHRVLIHFI